MVNPVNAQPTRIANVTLPATSDSYVVEEEPHEQHGSEDLLSIGYTENSYRKDCSFAWLGPVAKPSGCVVSCEQGYEGTKRNILLDFNLSSVPPGSEVISAVVRLHAYSPRDDIPVALYGLTESFSEKDVSWRSRIENKIWRTQGGSHELGILERGDLANFFQGFGYYAFNVTDYYSRVLRGEVENNGIIIKPELKDYSGSGRVTVAQVTIRTTGDLVRCKNYADSLNAFAGEKRKKLYADFYSKELAIKEGALEYAPALLLKFKGPSVQIRLDGPNTIRTGPGKRVTLNLSIEGSYSGPLDLSYDTEDADGFSVRFDGRAEVGSKLRAIVDLSKDIPAGNYRIKFLPMISKFNNSYFSEISGTEVTLVVEGASKTYGDFSMYCYTEQVNVTRGGSASFRVNVVYRGSFWAKVALSSSAPQGLVLSFDPTEGIPDFASNVTVNASEDAPLGLHEVTLMGTGGNITRSVKVKVNVLERTVVPISTRTEGTQTTGGVETDTKEATTNTTMTVAEGGLPIPYITILILVLALMVSMVLLRKKTIH
ncbi:MAG: DNRLRE domain-containing protein [Candidatus Korarchaeum sp.]